MISYPGKVVRWYDQKDIEICIKNPNNINKGLKQGPLYLKYLNLDWAYLLLELYKKTFFWAKNM